MGHPADASLTDRAVPIAPLPPAALLTAWEEGAGRGAVDRALTLLTRALPGADREALADLPVGRRDGLLLELRERCFGPVAECVVRCPTCQETLEFPLQLRSLRVAAPEESHGVVVFEGLCLEVRPATSRDMRAVSGMTDPGEVADALLRRCVTMADPVRDDTTVPTGAAEAVAAEMARLDPQADLRLELSCVACGMVWTSVFDVVTYLWREVESEARRTLAEVDALARVYGWSEGEILGLSPSRRRAYLRLVGA